MNRKITAFTAGSAKERLILYLLHLPLGSDGSWELDVSYGALSEQLGVGRASLYRAMDSLCEAGYIERNKNHPVIPGCYLFPKTLPWTSAPNPEGSM